MIVQNWWFTTLMENKYTLCPPLKKDIECDICIIGAGMSGTSTAAALIGKGYKVVIIEKNIFGGSSSGRSAGFLTPDSELELSQLVRRYGIEGAKKIWGVPVRGSQYIKENVTQYKIACDFRMQDSLFVGIGKSGWQDVQDELACREQVGFTNQEIFNKEQLSKILNSTGYDGAVRYSDTYGIIALQYLQGMKQVLLNDGVQIYESTEVRSIRGNTAYTHAGSVTAKQLVVAIDKMQRSFNPLADEVFHAQTFLSISEPLSDKEVAEMFPSGKEFQMWDSKLVYSYWRLVQGNRLLLGGGSAITTFLTNPTYNPLIIEDVHKEFRKHFPFLKNLKFVQYWPGRIDTTRDLLPTIVKDRSNPTIHFILGVVGLPWASFCGDFVAKNILGTAEAEDQKYYEYFSDRRYYFLPTWVEQIGRAHV